MFLNLLRSRRFAPLFWCQFLSAFNDNFVRNMLAMLVLFRLGAEHAASLTTLAVGIFILPSIFASALGGEIADSSDKAYVARRLKFAEIFVQTIAGAGFVLSSVPLLFLALFGLGLIAALFGPIKYGILPDHLKLEELTAGNALVEGATFFAILLGLLLGGLAAADGRSPWSVVAQLAIVAFACWGTSFFIPSAPVAARGLVPDWNLFRSTWRVVNELRDDMRIWKGALVVSWFWLVGAVALSMTPILLKNAFGASIELATAVNALFAIGIAAGSLAAAVWARGRIFLRPLPIAALGMGAFLIDVSLSARGLPASPQAETLVAFLTSRSGLHFAADVLGLAASGGLFVVPSFAAVQAWAGEDRRARVIAGVNVLNSVFIVAGSLAASALQNVGASERALFAGLGALNLFAAAWVAIFFSRIPIAQSET